jgi:hypothetical protein
LHSVLLKMFYNGLSRFFLNYFILQQNIILGNLVYVFSISELPTRKTKFNDLRVQCRTGFPTISLFQPLRACLRTLWFCFTSLFVVTQMIFKILRMCAKWLLVVGHSSLKNAPVLCHIIISANRSLLRNIYVFCHVTECRHCAITLFQPIGACLGISTFSATSLRAGSQMMSKCSGFMPCHCL